jgi:hypothetical protein
MCLRANVTILKLSNYVITSFLTLQRSHVTFSSSLFLYCNYEIQDLWGRSLFSLFFRDILVPPLHCTPRLEQTSHHYFFIFVGCIHNGSYRIVLTRPAYRSVLEYPLYHYHSLRIDDDDDQKNTIFIIMLLLPKTSLLLLSLSLIVSSHVVESQYACSLAAPADEKACITAFDDAGNEDHCAWCSLSSFGFCVSETQAAKFEQSIPGIECDRYSGDDDDVVVVDDDAAVADDDDAVVVDDDDAAPGPGVDDDTAANDDDGVPDDDAIIPSDDTVPDDYWTCLQAKDEASCGTDAGCTWCTTKVGFGLCMAGPSAESAANSDWFTCATGNTTITTPTPEEQEEEPDQM